MHRRHAALEGMANRTRVRKKDVSPASGREELLRLINREVAPANCALLQGEIERRVLIRGEADAGTRVCRIADGPDLHAIVAGRQLLDPVSALRV